MGIKVIFLDIGGVLNSAKTKECVPSGRPFIDKIKIQLLKQIIDTTGAKIVLTATYRHGWLDIDGGKLNTIDAQDYLMCKAELEKYGIYLFDKVSRDYRIREQEIAHWLENFPDEIENFIILDDKPIEKYADKLVLTSFDYGLTQIKTMEAIELLQSHR